MAKRPESASTWHTEKEEDAEHYDVVQITTAEVALERVESTLDQFGVDEEQLEEIKALASTYTFEEVREVRK